MAARWHDARSAATGATYNNLQPWPAGASCQKSKLWTGCNTVQGFGQDIAATGRAVEDVATYNEPAPRYYYEGRYYIDRSGNRHYY